MKFVEFIAKARTKSGEVVRGFFLFKLGAHFRRWRKRPLPSEDKVLIHIGCGVLNDRRYINVDTRPGWHIDYVESIENFPRLFPPDYADLIYACHVLEHVSYLAIPKTLKGLYRCLKKGGILRLSVPDFRAIIAIYREKRSVPDIMALLMGGQGYPGNFHFSVFDEDSLTEALGKAGFAEVRSWDPASASFHDFEDWSRRQKHLYGRNWTVSLNLEAVK
ncbi:MAG: methyltransferase domain-containing protein [Candidatus Aminicenantes bacterium]|nr:methyltransferase domain-containing protein [Candidatus Aminicenantes bacterium]